MPAEFEGSHYKDPTEKAVWDPIRALAGAWGPHRQEWYWLYPHFNTFLLNRGNAVLYFKYII